MASVTLPESGKLAQNALIAGVIESVVTVDNFYEILPFDEVEGNALAYNREATLAPVATVGVGDTDGDIGAGVSSGSNQAERTAAKDAATFDQITSSLTTIMGDAEINGLIQTTRSGDNDQTATQIASKAKSAGRKYRDLLINGDATNYTFAGLLALCAATQKVNTGNNGGALSFEFMDALIDQVTDKDGQVDYITMPRRTVRSYYALLRALGGASINDAVELPSGAEVPAYRKIPIFSNDNIPTTQTKGTTAGTTTTIMAGTLDDGSRQHGIAGLTAAGNAGMHVQDVGVSQTKDEHIWRVIWYVGLALFSELGLAAAPGITN